MPCRTSPSGSVSRVKSRVNSVRVQHGSPLLASPVVQQMLPVIQQADPQKAAAIRRMLMQVDMLGRENVMVVEPVIPMMR